METNSVIDEVRSILDGGKKAPPVTEDRGDPTKEATDLLKTHRILVTAAQRKLDALSVSLGEALQQATRNPAAALEAIGGKPLEAMRQLRELIDASIFHVEGIAKKGTPVTESAQYVDMSVVRPGDVVKLTKQVFRVIGKSGSSAIVQPEKIAREVYGDFQAAPGYVKSPGDFAGRGGKTPQDTSTQAPRPSLKNPEGHISLVGTMVLNHNPHTGQFSFPSGKLPGEYAMADTIQIVGHDVKLPHVVGEDVTVERFELTFSEAKGDTTEEKLQQVAEGEGPMLVNGVFIDTQSARAILTVQEALGEENQERMAGLPVQTMASVAWRLINQGKVEAADSE